MSKQTSLHKYLQFDTWPVILLNFETEFFLLQAILNLLRFIRISVLVGFGGLGVT